MAKRRVAAVVKIQIQAGAATPAPPVGTALGPHGINIMDFCKAYNAADRSAAAAPSSRPRSRSTRTGRSRSSPRRRPTPVLLRQAAGIEKGSQTPAPRDGRIGHQGAGARDRGDEDARPQRDRPRRCDGAGRRHRPIDGHRRHRLVDRSNPAAGGRTSPADRGRRRPRELRPKESTSRRSAHARQEVHRRRPSITIAPGCTSRRKRSTW